MTAAAHIIVDSSIWIDHFNKGDAELSTQLKRRRVILHPMVVAEVALGSITNRRNTLIELQALPQAMPAFHAEVMAMIEWLELSSSGIGYVDAHLLASARQISNGRIWTRDKKLREQAKRLGVDAGLS